MLEGRPKQVFNIAAIAAIAAISTSDPTAADPHVAPAVDEPRQVSGFELASEHARYALMAETGQIILTSVNGRTRYEVEMTMSVDGVERPIALRKGDVVR